MANANTIRAPIMKKSIRGLAGLFGLGEHSMSRREIADKHPPNTDRAHIDVMHLNMERDFHIKKQDEAFLEAHNLANRGGFLPQIIDKHPFLKMMNKVFKRGEP